MVALADRTRVAGTRFDNRRRLTEEDKADIRSDYERGEGIRAIARCYGVSKRLIQFPSVWNRICCVGQSVVVLVCITTRTSSVNICENAELIRKIYWNVV